MLSDRSLVEAVRALAAENPDFVYVNPSGDVAGSNIDIDVSCFYVHQTSEGMTPGCLIGHAAVRAGMSIEDVAKWDDKDEAGAVDVLPDSISEGVREWAEYIQVSQDTGSTWADSVTFADKTIGDPLV